MKSQEKELGVTLLDRTTRRVELTDAGQAFLPFAKRMARTCNELEGALADIGSGEKRAARKAKAAA